MARRKESVFATAALLLLLSLTVLYGCRAFEPEVKIINLAPETYLIGAPAETTGAGFTRHLFWYGTDEDGEVVQFIYAITDSTVRDPEDPTNDEEDDRFNPVEDVTTLETTEERYVGWTSKTDSVFVFTVDRGSTPSKEITFHMVAVDDRGAIDPTPARLRFFNNSLGNPTILFRVYVDDANDPDNPQWRLRWEGTPRGATASSPEQTVKPFVPFGKAFRIEWEGSSPNGAVTGYRFKALQSLREFTPARVAGEKQWAADLTSYVYRNQEAPGPALAAGCNEDGTNCPPDRVRFPSQTYVMAVEARDIALVESDPTQDGILEFEVNYPPATSVVEDASFPHFEVRDAGGAVLTEGTFSRGDTIPANSTVTFKLAGFDRFASTLPPGESDSLFCCDTPLDFDPNLNPGDPNYVPEVRYQSRLTLVRKATPDAQGFPLSNQFTDPEEGDTLSFWAGPLDFVYIARTVDEHRRPDPEPEEFDFVSGFKPLIRRDLTIPSVGGADTLLIHPSPFTRWGDDPADDARNEIRYEAAQGLPTRYLVPDTGSDCGFKLTDVFTEGAPAFNGFLFNVFFDFVGEQDPRDPLSPVKAWAFSINSDADPQNLIEDGRESRDLSLFVDSPIDNRWEWQLEDALQIWLPLDLLIAQTDAALSDFNPAVSQNETRAALGCILREQLGRMHMRIVGRTTSNADEYVFNSGTRKDTGGAPVKIGQYGRRSEVYEVDFEMRVGLRQNANPNTVWVYWPNF